MKQVNAAGLVMLIGLLTALPVSAATSQKVSVYAIHGQTWEALKQQMDQKGPRGFYGWTSYEIAWRFQWSEAGGNCRLTSVDVDTDIEITMPEWRDHARAERALQWHWRRFYDALLEHEQVHVEMALTGAEDIKATLSAIGERSSCSQLETEANQLGHQILERVRQKNQRFDEETDHGRQAWNWRRR
ncbi:MAG: DUF922 domain-containing protein [Gammaproteobacteria bacterium]